MQYLQSDYTLGPTIFTNQYHDPILHTHVPRSFDQIIHDFCEESAVALRETILPAENNSGQYIFSMQSYHVLTGLLNRMGNTHCLGHFPQ